MPDESQYRTSGELSNNDRRRRRVQPVIDRAIADTRMSFAAMLLEEPAEVFDMWCRRVFNGLRRLTPEDRILVIVMLLEDHAYAQARELVTLTHPVMPETVGGIVGRVRRLLRRGGAR